MYIKGHKVDIISVSVGTFFLIVWMAVLFLGVAFVQAVMKGQV